MPASFSNVTVLSNLGDFIQGNVDFSTIELYGLPLDGGIIGGFSAWPLETSFENKFSLTANGNLYAIQASCCQPTKIDPAIFDSKINGTLFSIANSLLVSGIFTAEIYVAYPALSHDFISLHYSPIQQVCKLEIICGNGLLTLSFEIDEWNKTILNQISSVTVYDQNGSSFQALNNHSKQSSNSPFSTFHQILSSNQLKYSNYTREIQLVVEQVFNNSRYYPSQSASFSKIQSWAAYSDGYYHVNSTWKGLSAALSATASTVFIQYNENVLSTCSYSASIGAGILNSPNQFVWIIGSIGLFLILILLYQLAWWLVLFNTSQDVDLACRSLNLPLRFLLESADDSFNWVTRGQAMSSCTDARLLNEYSKKCITFGETGESRKQEIGTLAISSDSTKLIILRRGRNYR